MWRHTLLIITYDEHGGFYDHVMPPLAEIRTLDPQVSDPEPTPRTAGPPAPVKTYYGVRVPTFVVSPWCPAGKGPDIVLDHCSIAKTILARFLGDAKPFLSDRVHLSRTFDAFLSAPEPRMDVPPSPLIVWHEHDHLHELQAGRAITTAPLFRRDMMRANVDFHELTGTVARLLGR